MHFSKVSTAIVAMALCVSACQTTSGTQDLSRSLETKIRTDVGECNDGYTTDEQRIIQRMLKAVRDDNISSREWRSISRSFKSDDDFAKFKACMEERGF